MVTKALATVWRRMGTRGIVILLITAFALALVLKSDFSTAIWGNNRESGLFVLVGLAGFGGAFVSLIWAGGFVVSVLVEWNRLRRSAGTPKSKDALCSKAQTQHCCHQPPTSRVVSEGIGNLEAPGADFESKRNADPMPRWFSRVFWLTVPQIIVTQGR
jgi:Zn-dependent protease with chaperone function